MESLGEGSNEETSSAGSCLSDFYQNGVSNPTN